TNVNTVSSKGKRVHIPKITLHEYLWRNLDKWSNKTAIICFETQRSYTYNELYKRSLSVTRFLKESLKLESQDTVGLILQNLPEYPIVLLGAIQAGLKVTTCNPTYTIAEIKNQLQASKTRLIFTSSNLLPIVQQAVTSINENIPIVEITLQNGVSSNTISFKEISSGEGCKPVDVDVNETILLPYSSGTTGLPKGVQLSHFNIVANLCQITAPEFSLLRAGYEEQDVVPAFLPFFHIYGLTIVMLKALSMGAKLVAMPAFTSDNFIKLLQNFKPTVVYGIPLVVTMATNNPNIKTEDLSCIRILMSGAAPLGATDVERFVAKTKNKVNLYQGYGMTETSPLTLVQTKELEHGLKIGGSGFLIPNTDAKIISTDGSSSIGLSPNQSGELVMQGYYNNPQSNKEIFLEGGWIKTGDIAHYDEHEHFYITDRLKELIKVKGFQVAPAELEEILRNYPGVEDAAVIGVPHPVHGEVPKAFVVTKAGESIKPRHLEEFVAAKVAKHKHLTGGVVLMETIPKSASGKILRRELRKL
ncbi:4-coumarate--CoA ligase 1-like, partial [Asbolus verrucosus]